METNCIATLTRTLLLAWVALSLSVWGEAPAAGSGAMLPLGQRPTLLGGPNSPEAWLFDRGLGLDISWTQFGQAMVAPKETDNGLKSGGKLNAKLNLDFSKMGLWEGFSASALRQRPLRIQGRRGRQRLQWGAASDQHPALRAGRRG